MYAHDFNSPQVFLAVKVDLTAKSHHSNAFRELYHINIHFSMF